MNVYVYIQYTQYSVATLIVYESIKLKTMTVTETCNVIKNEMLAKLEQQKQEFIEAYIKTYGEYPKCYADEENKGK